MKNLIMGTVLLLASCVNAYAFDVVGTPPPKTHTVELGTYTAYASPAGSVRYFKIEEDTKSICSGEYKLLQTPSATYSIRKGGTYKYWKSPTEVLKPYPVTFNEECKVPESPDVGVPPVSQEVNFVGLHRVAINPILDVPPSTCTFAEFDVYAKTFDGKYLFKFKRIHDASVTINGVQSCQYGDQ